VAEQPSLDAFRAVLAGAARAMAREPELELSFAEAPSASHRQIRVPKPRSDLPTSQVAEARGFADGFALRQRFHDAALHDRLAPSEPQARMVFAAIEQARIEAIGARGMDGVAANLRAATEAAVRTDAIVHARARAEVPLATALHLIVHERLTGVAAPADARPAIDLVHGWIEEVAGALLDGLALLIDDQAAFAARASRILERLDLVEADPMPFAFPSGTGPAGPPDASARPAERGEDGEPAPVDGVGDSEPDTPEDAVVADTAEEEDGIGFDMGGAAKRRPPRRDPTRQSDYRPYTTEFDEVVHASTLADCDELDRLRADLDRQLAGLHDSVTKLANRLQRRLMAQHLRRWEFDQEDGLLDPARLARVVINPMATPAYKTESESPFRDTLVTLLIDNSGSMRGSSISTAAISADILTRTLERCGVRTEILGFTTSAWDGGRSRQAWLKTREPRVPGRLSDLRHIIYKGADEPWRRARRNLGLMIRDGLLKENIDGEALLWAHERMIGRPEARRFLMVISDGAPVDESTLGLNSGSYLEDHLRQVIRWIEASSPVQLVAIGIKHDVTRYYKRAITISDAGQLGDALAGQLADLFDSPGRTRKDR